MITHRVVMWIPEYSACLFILFVEHAHTMYTATERQTYYPDDHLQEWKSPEQELPSPRDRIEILLLGGAGWPRTASFGRFEVDDGTGNEELRPCFYAGVHRWEVHEVLAWKETEPLTDRDMVTLRVRNLRARLCSIAAQDTAYRGVYTPDKQGMLHNHCGVVAMLLYHILGGEIYTGMVPVFQDGKYKNVRHYWNRLPGCDTLVDLTSNQFVSGNGWRPVVFGHAVKDMKGLNNERFQLFLARYRARWTGADHEPK